MEEIKLNGESKDITQDNIDKLKELFPEIVTEGMIDFDKLKMILGENIDDSNERYDFTWAGKSQAIKESQKPSQGTLIPSKEDSKNWDTTQNLYIEGDNLEVLKLLQKSYYNKVKMIYIDPPYNTGKDFIYSDNYSDNLENYLEFSSQLNEDGQKISTNAESSGRFHTSWLNMMYPRLKLARNLLKEDGVIFISIDDNEIENLKKLCNEIFGEENFVGQWNWYKSETPPNLSYKIKKNVEYILTYEKHRNNNKYKGLKKTSSSDDPLTKPQNTIKELKFKPGTLNIKLKDQIISKGIYGTEKYPNELLNDLEVKNNTNVNTVIFRNRFIWVQEKLDEELQNNTKMNLSKNLVLSYKKAEYSNEVPANFISAKVGSTTEKAGKELTNLFGTKLFDYPKPVELIKFLFNFLDSEKDIFLDFFSGSASTAEALMSMNSEDNNKRKFIMVQIPEPITSNDQYDTICDIGKSRIDKTGDKIIEESGIKDLDIGFKVFKLNSSNLTKWNPNVDDLESSLVSAADNIVEGRTSLDLVYEIMLKYGLELALPVEEISKDIFSVAYGSLVVCLRDDVSSEVINEIFELVNGSAVSRVVFKDNGFKSDADKTNIKENLRVNGVDEFITI